MVYHKHMNMKKLLLLTATVTFTLSAMSQGKSQKKEQVKTIKTDKHTNVNQNTNTNVGKNQGHDGVNQSNRPTTAKYSKNLPTNVSASFIRDYPNATNVTWTKSRGNWIASFPNGYYRTSVSYTANGQRTNTTRRRLRL